MKTQEILSKINLNFRVTMANPERVDQILLERPLAIPIAKHLIDPIDDTWDEETLRDEIEEMENLFYGIFETEEGVDQYIIDLLDLSGEEAEEHIRDKHERWLYLTFGAQPHIWLYSQPMLFQR